MYTDDKRAQHDSSMITTSEDTALTPIEEQADRSIRRLWYEGRLCFSVIDVIGLLTESANPRNYWNMLKARLAAEGAQETYTKCVQLRMMAADGKQRLTDTADTETLLRIIQSVPSPKAEPVKQWLARVGAQHLDTVTHPADTTQGRHEAQAMIKPGPSAPTQEWLEYYEQMVALLRRQLAYEAHLATAQNQLDEHEERLNEHDQQFDHLHSRLESLEESQRLLPELLERLGPQTLTPTHQAKVKELAVRLHELGGFAFGKIYGELNMFFHVSKYSDIPDAQWERVEAWFQVRLDAAERYRNHR